MRKMRRSAIFSLILGFIYSINGSVATADELELQNVYFFGTCNVELDGKVVMDGDCYSKLEVDIGGREVFFFYDKPKVVGGQLKFEDLVVLSNFDGDVNVAYENGDGIHYLMGDFRFDGDCYVGKRGKMCNHVYEAAD